MLRFLNTIFILVGIGFFGMFDFTKDQLFVSLNTYDISLLLINLIFVILVHQKRVLVFSLGKPFCYILYIYLFVIMVMVSMPLRGDISIIDSIRVGRNFLLFPLTILIWYDLVINKNKDYYNKLVLIIAIITSIQIIITAIKPDWISSIFEHIRAREHYKYGLQRNDFISNTMLFPHLATLIIFQRIIKHKLERNTLLLFMLFFIASSLQGFRSYFLVLCIILLGVGIRNIKKKKVRKYAFVSIFLLPLFVLGDQFFLNSQISNKFITSSMDIEKDDGSSLKGRFDRDLIYAIPKFIEKPIFGWGFIYPSSRYGKNIGLETSENGTYQPYYLYSVDSGYLTLLNYFGIVGFILVFYFLIKYLIYIRKYFPFGETLPVIGFSIILILPLVTHGGLYSDFGLLPFLIASGNLMGRNYRPKIKRKVKYKLNNSDN